MCWIDRGPESSISPGNGPGTETAANIVPEAFVEMPGVQVSVRTRAKLKGTITFPFSYCLRAGKRRIKRCRLPTAPLNLIIT